MHDTPSNEAPTFSPGSKEPQENVGSGASVVTQAPAADFAVASPLEAELPKAGSASAYDAVDRQLGKAADFLETAAEFVDDRFSPTDDAASDGLSSRSVTRKMRQFAAQVRAQESRELADRARSTAARHPVYTLGVGAALGAIALGILARSGGKGRA